MNLNTFPLYLNTSPSDGATFDKFGILFNFFNCAFNFPIFEKSFFAKIFGLKEKEEFESTKIQEINGNDRSQNEFKNEIKEIIEENTESKIDTNEFRIKENKSNLSELTPKIDNNLEDEEITNLETNKSQNEIDDDLLQIPAFLRRQAN